MWLVLACSPPAPTIAWVSETGGTPVVRWSEAGGPPAQVPGLGDRSAFPGDPDPRRTHLLVVTSEDSPGEDGTANHREELLLVPLDGKASPTLLAAAQMVRNPRWLPDGSALVFESDAHSFRDLYRVPREGGPVQRLTETEWGSFEPAVSFDGKWLAWGASTDGNAEIFVARADGSASRRFTTEPTEDTSPAFLPDGRLSWIAARGGLPRVWVAELSGADAHPLRPAEAPGAELSVAWSKAGTAAISVSPTPGALDLLLVASDGVEIATLAGPGPDEFPSWSPDGARLVFASSREGDPAIFVSSATGTSVRRITAGPGPDWLPRWLGP